MFATLLLAAAPLASAATLPVCPPEAARRVSGREAGRARPLGSEPPAGIYRAVRYLEGGCSAPRKVTLQRPR